MTKALNDFKIKYRTLQQSIEADFLKNPDTVAQLLLSRSNAIDGLLKRAWKMFGLSKELCLVAVGGYGRRELHLYSDIDLLILIPNKTHKKHQEKVAKFLVFLWDIGLEVGHSTRDLHDFFELIEDLSVVTNLLESRLLIGKKLLFSQMKLMVKSSDWSSQLFLVEKQKEQSNRHLKFAGTAYNLEPNIKESPGGLRDIQTIIWVSKWYFDVNTLSGLVGKSYLRKYEYTVLKQGLLFLWKVRFALHVIASRREDRLAFQLQKETARILGYVDSERLAVEQFMKDYYQTATKILRLNDILLQLLEDKILHTQNFNARFIISYGYIQTTNEQVFKKTPSALIEIFLVLAKHNYVQGISANTLRQMQRYSGLIDKKYHKKRQNNRLFIELLQQRRGVNKALKLMNRYGVLERYIPAFGKIVGLMQYDLFHAYTVDQHSLFVIRNLRRFFIVKFDKEFALCSQIAQTIDKPELLLLAGLFHDIAKGKGGDHAKLGAKDASNFCKYHQLKADDVALVSGLVKHHLLMSQVAQKQDIDDFEVIEKFANTVGTIQFLEFLYLLTVADIRATKADLWNDWKDSLLQKLFYKTKQQLLDRITKPPNSVQKISTIKDAVMSSVEQFGFDMNEVEKIFSTLPKEYFLRYEVGDIVWHLRLLMQLPKKKISISSRLSKYNVIDIFVYADDMKGLFFKLVSIIEKLQLDIVDAKILTTKNHKAYNTISVLQDDILEKINLSENIQTELNRPTEVLKKPITRRVNRYFEHPIKIKFTDNEKLNLTQLDITMIDKQGLLSNIAYIFYQFDIRLINARIATLGERVEDIFFITNAKKQPLSLPQQRKLKKTLEEVLA